MDICLEISFFSAKFYATELFKLLLLFMKYLYPISCVQAVDNTVVISGVGVNLDNRSPTTCINEIIAQLNSMASGPREKLAPLSCEKLLAVTFTQLEGLLNAVQAGHVQQVLDLYYSYWLHRFANITSPHLKVEMCSKQNNHI
jgi:biotin-(acetyl-CoA carboxylase) ligase